MSKCIDAPGASTILGALKLSGKTLDQGEFRGRARVFESERDAMAAIRADQIVGPEEQSWTQHMCEALDVSPQQWMAILEEGGGPEIDLTPLKRLSTQVRCVEDMIEISLADGDMADSEKQLLMKAARTVGITSQQVLRILDEAKKRLSPSM